MARPGAAGKAAVTREGGAVATFNPLFARGGDSDGGNGAGVRVAAPAPHRPPGRADGAVSAEEAAEDVEMFRDIMYSFNSFLAVFWPVALTLCLSGLAVVYIDDGTNGNPAPGTSTLPTVRDESEADGGAERLGAAALNALLIVGIITAATFFMVLLYKYNCFRVMVAWLVLSTAMLLGLSTSYMVQVAFLVYEVAFDAITFWIFFYNLAVVGVLAIFYQRGIPPVATQGYLVLVSVVMPWLLVRFLPEWTCWALLVLLALYDLCAVLTPCGPLNLLLGVAEKNDHALPGLLYEAQVRGHRMDGDADTNGRDADDPEARPQRPARRDNNDALGVAPLGGFIFMAHAVDRDSAAPARRRPSADHDAAARGVRDPDRPPRPDEMVLNPEAFADRNSIKLGLGDFVFYSVLCSRAALQGFATFAAVFVTVFAGLAGTLFLLAVYQKALPALPISILAGVPLFFLTDLLVTPLADGLTARLTAF